VRGDLWELFLERFEAVGGIVSDPEVVRKSPVPIWVEPGLDLAFPGLEEAVEPWDAATGLGRADLAIAETGSLLFTSGPERPRLLSLLPPRHVALLNPATVVATLEEAVLRIDERNWTVVTGPSRTADIEGVLVRGVHGPRELIVVPFPE
jgi:L-lactate dehydrogenase complex protein LldG